MAQPLSEYFALEAGEFLDQLDALLASSERPDPMRFFRLARGVRGSAQLAGATAIATVAERLEDGARAIRDGVLPWSPEVRDRARATAGDLRALVIRFGADWAAADDDRARAAADRWIDVAGARRETGQQAPGDELFGFVRREITGVVAELDRVLGELRENPEARDPLRVVLRRMRPVRGVAGMEVLAPVLEGLEGIEDTAHEILGRASAVSAAELELLGAARDALDAAGRTLANGEPPGDSAELVRMRELRDRADDAQDAGGGRRIIRTAAWATWCRRPWRRCRARAAGPPPRSSSSCASKAPDFWTVPRGCWPAFPRARAGSGGLRARWRNWRPPCASWRPPTAWRGCPPRQT
jgi:HPt (histidine-containing phosphotransfer) domain-containing protein